MGIFESIDRHPAEYLPTGDKALLVAWAVLPRAADGATDVHVVLCLGDGTVVLAALIDVKFDYRYDWQNQRWVDVSRVTDGPLSDEGSDDIANQATTDDGGTAVQGRVPDPDGASEGDPLDQP